MEDCLDNMIVKSPSPHPSISLLGDRVTPSPDLVAFANIYSLGGRPSYSNNIAMEGAWGRHQEDQLNIG